jgi:hypothetical protein
MTRLFYFLIILSFLGIGSCKKKATDPDYCSTAWTTTIQDELTAISNAAAAYGNNPTTTTCNALKAAYEDYIDALEPFGNCTLWSATTMAQWQDMIDEARAELPTLCDE